MSVPNRTQIQAARATLRTGSRTARTQPVASWGGASMRNQELKRAFDLYSTDRVHNDKEAHMSSYSIDGTRDEFNAPKWFVADNSTGDWVEGPFDTYEQAAAKRKSLEDDPEPRNPQSMH